jgi:hypothetical protein
MMLRAEDSRTGRALSRGSSASCYESETLVRGVEPGRSNGRVGRSKGLIDPEADQHPKR